jgi:hypothetical protein
MTIIYLSRRSLISGLFATTIFPINSIKAFSAEPMTILAASAAVVGIISGVSSILSDKKKESIIHDINIKLEAVIRTQSTIISELKSIKLYIDASLQRAFRENAIVRMNAHQDRYEILATERPSDRNRSEYLDLQASVSQTAFELGQLDVPAFIAFGAGVGMTLAIHQALGLSRARFDKLKEVFRRPYEHWLDSGNANGITATISATQSEIDRRTKELDARPRTVESKQARDGCILTTTTSISGNLQDGFTGSNNTTSRCFDSKDPCARIRNICPTSLEDEFLATENQVASVLQGMFSSSKHISASELTEVTSPQFVPSGIEVVDQMNRERIVILDLMNVLARQVVIKEQMEMCLDALST